MAFPILQDALLTTIHFFLYYLNPFIITLRIKKKFTRVLIEAFYYTKPKFFGMK